ATRRQREVIFRQAIEKSGAVPVEAISRADIQGGIDARQATPHQARHFLDSMRHFFKWAVTAQLVEADPTAGLASPAIVSAHGFPIWTLSDLEKFERRWPVGTRQRVWLDVLLYTGLRRGDAVQLGRQHMREL